MNIYSACQHRISTSLTGLVSRLSHSYQEGGTKVQRNADGIAHLHHRYLHNKCPNRDATTVAKPFAIDAKPFSAIPGPAGIPWLGTLPYYWFNTGSYSVSRYMQTLQFMQKKYGNVVKEKRADGEVIVHLFDPEDVKAVFQAEGRLPYIVPLAQTTQHFRHDIKASPGLGNVNGEDWYRLRKHVHIFSKPKEVGRFLKSCDDTLNEFISNIKRKSERNNGNVDNMVKDLERWTLESAGDVIFEKKLGMLDDNPSPKYQKFIDMIVRHMKITAEVQFSSVKLHRVFNTAKWKEISRIEEYRYEIIEELLGNGLDEMRMLLDAGEIADDRFKFLCPLLSDDPSRYREALDLIKDKSTEKYEDVVVLGLSLFGDGLITTSPTSCALLHYMSNNPDIQEKCYQEIMTHIGGERCVEPDMLARLSYIKACVKETLRLFPVGAEMIRIPDVDLTVGGFSIPAGTVVHLNANAMLTSHQYFKDPLEYIPDRWLRGNTDEVIHPYMHLPFSHGPRQCAGRRIAEQELHCLLIKLLQNFRINSRGQRKLGQLYQTLQAPDMSIDLHLEPRT